MAAEEIEYEQLSRRDFLKKFLPILVGLLIEANMKHPILRTLAGMVFNTPKELIIKPEEITKQAERITTESEILSVDQVYSKIGNLSKDNWGEFMSQFMIDTVRMQNRIREIFNNEVDDETSQSEIEKLLEFNEYLSKKTIIQEEDTGRESIDTSNEVRRDAFELYRLMAYFGLRNLSYTTQKIDHERLNEFYNFQ